MIDPICARSLQRRRGADDHFQHERLVDLLPEHHVFFVQLIFETLDFFKRLFQLGSRAVMFGNIYSGPDRFHDVAALVHDGMADTADVFDRSIWKHNSIIFLTISVSKQSRRVNLFDLEPIFGTGYC